MRFLLAVGLLISLSAIPLSGCGGNVPQEGTVLVEEDLHLDAQEGPADSTEPKSKTPKSKARR